jgi:O-acetylhomoserine (thiol)-lyase
MKFDTALLHGNFNGDATTGATLTPIYQSSAFGQDTAEHIEKIFHNQAPGFAYTRINNPTIAAFENRITYLEGGIATVATSSGMAAISTTLLSILSSGDEIVSKASVYGGTLDFYKDLEQFGIKTRYVKDITKEELAKVVNEHTKVVFAETIGNPKLDVTDIKAAAEAVHSYGLPFVLDNTTATTYIVKGIEFGADIVINSASKYINGNSNSISGLITDSGHYKWTEEKFPVMKDYLQYKAFAFIAKLRNDTFRNLGCCVSPMNAYYNSLGIETLSLRMERHCANALKLASALEGAEGISTVTYPMLESSPYYELAKTQLGGKGGGIFTMRLYSKERAFAFINKLKYAINITNIGDTKTLVIHPSSTINAHSDKEEQENAGVYEDLIRVSVGIEDADDLIADFKEALDYVNKELPV